MDPTHAPILPPLSLLALRGGEGQGRKGGGQRGEEGGPGIPPYPSLSKANPAPYLGRAAKFW
jgi:hypothetical protein